MQLCLVCCALCETPPQLSIPTSSSTAAGDSQARTSPGGMVRGGRARWASCSRAPAIRCISSARFQCVPAHADFTALSVL